MNCSESTLNFRAFLEDSLEEKNWVEVREHLRECGDCRISLMSGDDLSVHLKKIRNIPLPQDVIPAVLREQSSHLRSSPRPRRVGVKFLKPLGLVLAVVTAAGVLWTTLAPLKKAQPAAPVPAASGQAQPGLAGLAAPAAEESSPERVPAGERGSGAGVALGKNVSLKPFHWHFIFENAEARGAFLQYLDTMGGEFSFRSPAAPVLSLSRPRILQLLEEARKRRVIVRGSYVNAGLPEFEGVVRVSFSMEVAGTQKAFTLTRHWHLTFALPNRFILLEKLKENGAQIVYESPEMWIFDVPGDKLEKVQDIARFVQGIKGDFGPELTSPGHPGVKIRVSAYVEEA